MLIYRREIELDTAATERGAGRIEQMPVALLNRDGDVGLGALGELYDLGLLVVGKLAQTISALQLLQRQMT
jgi:hypothetical protein